MSSTKMMLLLLLLLLALAGVCHPAFAFAPQSLRSPLMPTGRRTTVLHTEKSHAAFSSCKPQRHPLCNPSSSSSTCLFGIPKMFRWLTDQYPNVNRRLSEGLTDDVIVDNFYLDMNGIIHPCTHGNNESEIVVLDETAMFKKIFSYVDRLYKLVKPRRLLYLAVDGVAPRAKMNQQRSRRFRSAKDAEELSAEILARDGYLPEGKKFDSNCITPGTDFMLKLSLALQRWVEFKMKTDPFWQQGADVVVSGPDVPGEGEHKVMDYIRETKAFYYKEGASSQQRLHWEPNLTHVLYGLDADLIMLGLVTHEPNFLLLREKMSVVMAGRGRHKHRKKKDMLEYDQNDFELLELASLRELFAIQFRKFADRNVLKERYELSRIVDDFVFMCIMVGNDFLPHCPHLEIDNGALSLMLSNYIDLLPEWGGYLTNKDKIHPQRFEQFMYNLAVYEEEHFKRRGYEENEPGWQLSSELENEDDDFYGTWYGGKKTPKAAWAANKKISKVRNNVNIAELTSSSDTMKTEKKFHRKHPTDASRSYRDFYYETKLNWSPANRDETLRNRRAHVRDYLEGLHWVLNYYHNGCLSWDWFFPHLYSPLATDMVNLHEFYDNDDADSKDEGFKAFRFEKGSPFPSLAQLLSVLPPQSADLLPASLAELMINPSSPIAEYYPRDFTSDPNGKRQAWEAVVQIPFIDAHVLLEVVQSIIDADASAVDGKVLLANAERRRNVRGKSHTFYAPKRKDNADADENDSLAGVGSSRPRETRRPRRAANGEGARAVGGRRRSPGGRGGGGQRRPS